MEYKDALIAVGLSPDEPRVTRDIFGNEWEPEWMLCDPCDTQFIARLEQGSLISIEWRGKHYIGLIDMWRILPHEDDFMMVSILQKANTTDYVDIVLTGGETIWMEVVD
jgi:hypothetical protein